MSKINLLENENLQVKNSDNILIQEKKTFYEIYSKKTEQLIKLNSNEQLYQKFPEEKYDIIYLDPPWDYGGKLQYDRTSTFKGNKDIEKDVFVSSSNFKYPTIKLGNLKKLPIQKISKDDCLLFMWVSSPHLEQAIELGKSWNFEYKTIGFVWDKILHNPGHYTLSQIEICLIFKKGKIPNPRGARNIKQFFQEKRTIHSQKPDEIRQRIHKMFPQQKKIELFSRKKDLNWDSWGLDLDQ